MKSEQNIECETIAILFWDSMAVNQFQMCGGNALTHRKFKEQKHANAIWHDDIWYALLAASKYDLITQERFVYGLWNISNHINWGVAK